MAPTTFPSFFNGMPPAKIMILPLLEAWIPKNCPPDCECVARSLVAISKAREVYAFFWEMSMLPIQAPSMRTCATMLPPSSATAMFIGCPISLAFFSAAEITRRASSSFTADIDSSLQLFHHFVWRPEVRELVQKVAVRPDLIRNFSVRVDREEKIDNVVL